MQLEYFQRQIFKLLGAWGYSFRLIYLVYITKVLTLLHVLAVSSCNLLIWMSYTTFEFRILEVPILSLELNVYMCHSYCCHICGAVISGWCPLFTLYLTTQSGRNEHGEGTPQPHEKTDGCHRQRCTRKLEVDRYEYCVKESGEFHGTVQWPGYVYLREMNKMETRHLLG
jgi:hypothetical protein